MLVNGYHIDPDKVAEKRLKISGDRAAKNSHTGTYSNGQLMYRTTLKKGFIHGSWESWYYNGARRDSGRMRLNIPDGEWKIWYPNGQLKFHVQFNSVKYHSIINEIDRQPKYKIYKISEFPREKAIVYLQSPFRVETLEGKIEIHKSSFSPELYKQSLLNEPGQYNSPFQNGLLHGAYIAYHENGQIKEQGVFINGMKDGMWEEFVSGGLVSRGTYYHGKKAGEWRTYDANGKPFQFKQYNHQGKLLSQYDFKK